MLRQWVNWGWVLVGFVDLLKIRIVLYWMDGLCIGWLDCIAVLLDPCISGFLDIDGSGSYRLDWLGWIGWIWLDNNGWMRTHSFCKDATGGMDATDGTDGMAGLDGSLVGLRWDGRLLAPAGTGATEQERHHWLSGYCKQGTNGTYGFDGALVRQRWDGRTLAGATTRVPPWARNRSATVGSWGAAHYAKW